MKNVFSRISILFIAAFLHTATHGQMPGIWHGHFCYSNAHALANSKNLIYCASEHAIFSYDPQNGTTETINKVNQLTDVGVSAISFSEEYDFLLVGYSDGNIDIVSDSETVILSDLKSNKIIPNKSINNIYIYKDLAYLATDFGIVVIDLDKKEFKDTYILGDQSTYSAVNQIAIQEDKNLIWAATESGLVVAPLHSVNLADFANWKLYTDRQGQQLSATTEKIQLFGNRLYIQYRPIDSLPAELRVIKNNSISLFKKQPESLKNITVSENLLHLVGRRTLFIYDESEYLKRSIDSSKNISVDFIDALTDREGSLWVAEQGSGLINMQTAKILCPNGPIHDRISDIQYINKNDFRACFGVSGNYNVGSYGLYNGSWLTQIEWGIMEPVAIAQDPQNEDGFFVAGFSGGIFHYSSFYDQDEVYTPENSVLEYTWGDHANIKDLTVDYNGNVWVANWSVARPIKVLDSQGNWHNFSYPNQPDKSLPTKIIVDKNNNKWILDPAIYAGYVYRDGANISDVSDDRFVPITLYDGEDASFAKKIYTISEDKDGAMWIGTENGIATFSSVSSAFSYSAVDFHRIKVEIDSIIDYVLEGIDVISSTVDAGNRKWFGTAANGAFLLSENGTEVLEHFTTENSPLPSNAITVIAVTPQSGEVFFGTEKGIVSFLGDADDGTTNMENIKVIPNPVRENYRRDIYIRGLVEDATVKITDLAGNLVYEMYSYGGTAVWPGVNLLGNRPQTGVYFIFVSNDDGSETRVGKLIFIN